MWRRHSRTYGRLVWMVWYGMGSRVYDMGGWDELASEMDQRVVIKMMMI
jgi:hypothetical protein